MARVSVYSFPPTPQDWTRIQDVVRAYYVNQKMPLKDVRSVLRDRHGFRATERMIKARLKQWGYLKNAKKEDWHFLALLHEQRKQSGRSSTVFDVRGHRKTVKDLHRFIRNQNMTAEQFLDEARQTTGGKQVPNYIRATTPDTSRCHDSPLEDRDADYASSSPPSRQRGLPFTNEQTRNQFLRPQRPTNHERMRSMSASSNDLVASSSIYMDADRYQNAHTRTSSYMTTSSSSTSPLCTQMQMEFEMLGSQITQPVPLVSRIGADDISSWALISSSPSGTDDSGRSVQFVCSRCNQPSDQHFVSLDNFESHQPLRRNILNDDNHALHLPVSTKDEGSWLWVSRCFLACMCLKKGDQNAADQSLREAAKEFERLLEKKDRQLLTAAGLVMTVLHMHDQGAIARRVMESAYEVTQRTLAPEHPIAVTIKYLTASANISQREWGITSALLFDVYRKFLDFYPVNHEYVIAARYNYSWMLKFENELDEAEREAREVYTLSCQTFGEIHMQSITALAVVAGCIFPDPARTEECIAIFKQVVKAAGSSLGRHHPYTLEAKRRMAEKMVELSGPSHRTLKLFKQIVWGRVHMLGMAHEYSQGARERYQQELQTLALWSDTNGQPSTAQLELRDLFSPDSPGAWVKIGQRRTPSQHAYLTRPVENTTEIDDDDGGLVMVVDAKTEGSQSPLSNHDFEAY